MNIHRIIENMDEREIRDLVTSQDRQIEELKAQMLHSHFFSIDSLNAFSKSKMKGSAAIITIKSLGGGNTLGPVAIADGLSRETIDCIHRDIYRSYKMKLELSPGTPPEQGQDKSSIRHQEAQ